MQTSVDLQKLVLASLFAALTAVGALMAIPIGPVPIVLQNLFVMLMGLMLGPRWGLAGVSAYLLAGALGLPVFAGGTGGIARFVGPTGGYLVGYLPSVVVIGWLSQGGKPRQVFDALAVVAGTLMLYLCGVSWLKMITGMTWGQSLMVGMVPFLPGDIAKMIAAVMMIGTLRGMVRTKSSAAPQKA
ncbi:MAG: biotin transporter BioY [Desulfosarcina sp.]|nr:biotin transporter BioY [Desulfobacterales bacterium]